MKGLAFKGMGDDPELAMVIDAITRGQYRHSAILVDTPVWRDKVSIQFGPFPAAGYLIIEAVYPKVRVRLLTPQDLSEIDVYDVPSHTPEQHDTSMEWLIKQVGLQYDVPDLMRFLPAQRVLLGDGSDDSYLIHTFCSMLWFNYYRKGGTQLLNCPDRYVAPDMMSWPTLVSKCPVLTV